MRILPNNIINTGTLSAAPSLLSTMPVGNLLTELRKQTARSSSLTAQVITCTWTTNQRANMAALGMHNLTTVGTWKAEFFSDEACTVSLASSGIVTAFAGTPLAVPDVASDNDFDEYRNTVYYVGSTLTTVRGLKITLTDAANPDGFMEAAFLAAGEYFDTAYQMNYGGISLDINSKTEQFRMDGGAISWDKRGDYRVLRIMIKNIVDATELARFLAILRYIGKHKWVWVSMYPGSANIEELYHQGFYVVVDKGPFEPHYYGLTQVPVVFGAL